MVSKRIRVSAIIIRKRKVLLLHRKKRGREYWVLPGGGVEEKETGKEAVKREVKEETSLKVVRADFIVRRLVNQTEHSLYFCKTKKGKVQLGGPEINRHSKDDWYRLEWVKQAQVYSLSLAPDLVKRDLIKYLREEIV